MLAHYTGQLNRNLIAVPSMLAKRQLSLDKARVIALIMKNIYQMGELCYTAAG
jgi:hypothetical protein